MIDDFISWIWARHHNILSWYIRPLFLIPFCYFSYKHNKKGIVLTLIALATSMFWFPAPEHANPEVISMLKAEKEYLTGDWTVGKILLALLIPAMFTALGLAFWKRSLSYGVVVINAMILIKIIWTFVFAPIEGAMKHLAPALIGLAICNVIIFIAARKLKQQS